MLVNNSLCILCREVQRYLLSNLRWWIEEYKFDGFRWVRASCLSRGTTLWQHQAVWQHEVWTLLHWSIATVSLTHSYALCQGGFDAVASLLHHVHWLCPPATAHAIPPCVQPHLSTRPLCMHPVGPTASPAVAEPLHKLGRFDGIASVPFHYPYSRHAETRWRPSAPIRNHRENMTPPTNAPTQYTPICSAKCHVWQHCNACSS